MKRSNFAVARSLGQSFFVILALIALATQADCQSAKTKLAGKAILPENLHSEWLRTQHDPAIPAEDRVRSTINTFFIIKYDSWVQGTLLDFGFLFVHADPQAYEDYAYERGLMHYLLEGWKYWSNLLLRYEYQPKFYDLKVNEQEATVVMRPKAGIVHRRTPTVVDNGPWTDYIFSLELVSSEWLIRNVRCNDELHESYPQGTDWERLAAELPGRVKEFEAKGEAEHRERMQKDPEYKELMEKRQKMIREGLSGKKIEPEKAKFYSEITGYYEHKKKLVLFVYVHNNTLMVSSKGNPEGTELLEVRGKPDEFTFINKLGEASNLRFIRDNKNTVIKCILQRGESVFETTRINRPSESK